MSYTELIKSIIAFFSKEKMEYAVIGAYALSAYGYVRATRDIDFISRLEHRKKITLYLESLGFETINDTTAFTNHLHPIGATRIDFMYVEGKTADEIFACVEKKNIFNDISVNVSSPQHLIAMKLFASKNNHQRKYKDYADIAELVKLTNIPKDAIRDYFVKYEQEDFLEELYNQED